MIVQRDERLLPFFRNGGIGLGRGLAAVDQRMPEVLFHEAAPVRLDDDPAKDRVVRLGGKGTLVFKECEMPNLVEIKHDVVGDIAFDRAALQDRRNGPDVRDVAEGGINEELGIEKAAVFVEVPIIVRLFVAQTPGAKPI